MTDFASNTDNINNIDDDQYKKGFAGCDGDGVSMTSANINGVINKMQTDILQYVDDKEIYASSAKVVNDVLVINRNDGKKIEVPLPDNNDIYLTDAEINGTDIVLTTTDGNEVKLDISNYMNIEFATEEEIDKGVFSSGNKAVSALEYAKEIHIHGHDTYIGKGSGLGSLNRSHVIDTKWGNTAVGFRALDALTDDGWENINGNVAIGESAGYRMLGNNNTYIGQQRGRKYSGDNNIFIGANTINEGSDISRQSNNSIVIGNVHKYEGNDSILIGTTYQTRTGTANKEIRIGQGAYSTSNGGLPANGFDNTVFIGYDSTTDNYFNGNVHADNFVTNSDKRNKTNIQIVNVLQSGIEVYQYNLIKNGARITGWIAQQVREVLKAAKYNDEVIDTAVPKQKAINWSATLKNTNEWLVSVGLSKLTYMHEFEDVYKQWDNTKTWSKETTQDQRIFNKMNELVGYDDVYMIDRKAVEDLLAGKKPDADKFAESQNRLVENKTKFLVTDTAK